MKNREKLRVHLTSNHLFFYLDGRKPKRLIRDWLFDPSILLLPEEVMVDKILIDEEKRFRDTSVTSKIICKMVDDKIIKPEEFGLYFVKNRMKEVRQEINGMINRAKADKRISIGRLDRDVYFKKAGRMYTILNPICAEIVWRETGLPPIDANWRQAHHYYNWKFHSGVEDIKTILGRKRAFKSIIREFSELENPKNRILGTIPALIPELELLPDPWKNEEYQHALNTKSPDKWEDFVWDKTESNYEIFRKAWKNEGIKFMRKKLKTFAEEIREDEKEALEHFKSVLKYVYDEYTQPLIFSGKLKCLKVFSWASPAVGGLMSAVWKNPIYSGISLGIFLPDIIAQIQSFNFKRKYKDKYGWFFWLYDSSSYSKYHKLKTFYDMLQTFKL